MNIVRSKEGMVGGWQRPRLVTVKVEVKLIGVQRSDVTPFSSCTKPEIESWQSHVANGFTLCMTMR